MRQWSFWLPTTIADCRGSENEDALSGATFAVAQDGHVGGGPVSYKRKCPLLPVGASLLFFIRPFIPLTIHPSHHHLPSFTPAMHTIASLPLESFQLICSFCPLHVLACLRLVSKDFRNRVDGSLTARRAHATPSAIEVKNKHDRKACYVWITLKAHGKPITAVFDRYDPEHNFLEFVQHAEPTTIVVNKAANAFPEATLGRLDLNLWEEQHEEFTSLSKGKRQLPPMDIGNANSATPRRARRSSITNASVISTIDHQMGRELARPGPIPTLSQVRPIHATMTASLGSSAGLSAPVPSNPSVNPPPHGENYMARFARMVLESTGASSSVNQTRLGMSAAELAEEAQRLFHTKEPEVLSSKKEYKFLLNEGSHFVGDNDFVMRYTISFPEPRTSSSDGNQEEHSSPHHRTIQFKVDYIRVSWTWISSGALPTRIMPQRAGVRLAESLADPMTVTDPRPDLRIGRIYSARLNRVLKEVQQQQVSAKVRAELAMLGYDASIIPREFISVNLRSELVLGWITREKCAAEKRQPEEESLSALQAIKSRNPLNKVEENEDPWQFVESAWSIKQKSVLANMPPVSPFEQETEEEVEDQEALVNMVLELKQSLGQLTGRDILEEMLVNRGYSRELIWKYGFARRGVMDPVPDKETATLLLQKIITSEQAR